MSEGHFNPQHLLSEILHASPHDKSGIIKQLVGLDITSITSILLAIMNKSEMTDTVTSVIQKQLEKAGLQEPEVEKLMQGLVEKTLSLKSLESLASAELSRKGMSSLISAIGDMRKLEKFMGMADALKIYKKYDDLTKTGHGIRPEDIIGIFLDNKQGLDDNDDASIGEWDESETDSTGNVVSDFDEEIDSEGFDP